MEILEYLELHKREIIEDIFSLVRIPSVATETGGDKPYGEKCAEALDCVSSIAEREGLYVRNFDYHVVTATYGSTPEKLGILTHVDVVPEGDGWEFDPFFLTEHRGKIYGRGVADDKGAAVMSVWALKAITELGIPLKYGVRLIFGSGEEIGCHDLEYYMSKEKMPPYVFSPDASFPIVNTEKGRYCETFTKDYKESYGRPGVLFFSGGSTVNVVPQTCETVICGVEKEAVLSKIADIEKITGVCFTVSASSGNLRIVAEGRSAHASTPEKGKNAVTAMLSLVSELPLYGEPYESLKKLGKLFPYGDHYGESLMAMVKDSVSGKSTFSLDILECKNGRITGAFDGRISLNANRGNTVDPVESKFKEAGFSLTDSGLTPPHHVDKNSDFVKILGNAYEKYTGKKSKCYSMGGFTYVHDIANAVAFGPLMPRCNAHIHGPNEFMIIDDIIKGTAIFTRAVIDICS